LCVTCESKSDGRVKFKFSHVHLCKRSRFTFWRNSAEIFQI